MRKWGVRLIAVSFLFGAITAYIDITIKQNWRPGFLGFSILFMSGSSPESMTSQFNVMALIGLCVNLYIAYQLLKFKSQGRIWALVVLWISALNLVVGLVVLPLKNHVSPLATISVTSDYLNYTFKSSLLAILGSAFLFYMIQIYFLMRKDVKTEFYQQEIKSNKSEEQTAQ